MARGSMTRKAWIHFLMVTFVPCFSTAPNGHQPSLQFKITVKSAKRWAILNSHLTVAIFIAPWMAGVAGTFTNFVYVHHNAAMNPATNVGVAAPGAITCGKRSFKNEHNLDTGCKPG
jgi:hypothetical protein